MQDARQQLVARVVTYPNHKTDRFSSSLLTIGYWRATHSSTLRIASILQVVFSAAVNSFFSAAGAALKGEVVISLLLVPPESPAFWALSWTCLIAPRASFCTTDAKETISTNSLC